MIMKHCTGYEVFQFSHQGVYIKFVGGKEGKRVVVEFYILTYFVA